MSSRTTPLFKTLNFLMTPTLASRRDPDRAWDKAIAKAEQAAGVPVDEADRSWVEDFRFLINCVAEVPNLSPVGWTSTVGDAQKRTVNRLRIRELHRARPEIGAERIERPIFVVGLPRTATTLAHRVLAASSAHRGPLRWEMAFPDLPRSPEIEAGRIKQVRKDGVVTKFAPDFDVIHPIEVLKPEENILVVPQGLYHVLYHAPMPKYRAWYAERDTTPDYQYLKEFLQVLQHGREPRRWVLKNPLDLAEMATIRQVFPDAQFVWTHRDPMTVMGSLCSLMDLSYSLFLKKVDPDVVGQLALEVMVEAVTRGRAWRQQHPESVVDVPYHHLVSDPNRFVPQLYKKLGATWTLKDGEHLTDALSRPVRDRKHEYTASAFGLTQDRIERAFDDYLPWVTAMNN